MTPEASKQTLASAAISAKRLMADKADVTQGTLSGPASPRQAGAGLSASPVGLKTDAEAGGMAQVSSALIP